MPTPLVGDVWGVIGDYINAEDRLRARLTSRRMNASIESNKCSQWECVHRHIGCADTDECAVFWKQMYDAFYHWVDAMHEFNVSNTQYQNHIVNLSFQTISDQITLWWVNGGRFEIYHPGLNLTWDANSETVYDYYARVVNAIILELRKVHRNQSTNLSEDILPLRINLKASGRCIDTEPYNKLLQDTKQAIATVVLPSLHVYSIYSEEDGPGRLRQCARAELNLVISDVHPRRRDAFPLPSGWKYYE